MAFSDGVIDALAIISAVACHRRDHAFDLVEQVRDCRDISDVVSSQFHGHDLVGVGIDAEMQFPPSPARANAVLLVEPFTFSVNLDAGAVDEQMQRLVALNPFRQGEAADGGPGEAPALSRSRCRNRPAERRACRSLEHAKPPLLLL